MKKNLDIWFDDTTAYVGEFEIKIYRNGDFYEWFLIDCQTKAKSKILYGKKRTFFAARKAVERIAENIV